jgi:hypothetical protein
VFPTQGEADEVAEAVEIGEEAGILKGETKLLIKRFSDVFKVPSIPLQKMRDTEFRIRLKSGAEIPKGSRRIKLAPQEALLLEKHAADFIAEGLYFRGRSFYASGALVVVYPAMAGRPAKSRVVVDLRKVNDVSVRDVHDIPDVWDIIHDVARGVILGAFDGWKMFHQIAILDNFTRKLCAINGGESGVLIPTRMPQGHVNAASTAQRSVENMFSEFLHEFLRGYIDDLFLFSGLEEDLPLEELQNTYNKICSALAIPTSARVAEAGREKFVHFVQLFLVFNRCRQAR